MALSNGAGSAMSDGDERIGCGGEVLHAPRLVLDVALEAYVCIDVDGRVTAWNPAASETFGFSHAQACGRRVEELIIPRGFMPRIAPVLRGWRMVEPVGCSGSGCS
ncbi:PAS domain S-box protein [Actinoplanes xinjiangensis]|uniref:PAS domain S-box protein n=1 Tax=Actinoplanes xinjiangensis TaxID=512350 RepID=UPI003423B0DA